MDEVTQILSAIDSGEEHAADELLRLFLQVCHAVQHAHQRAVIHRDLKPTNILVTELDGEAVPKVIDFGVAKALGQQLTEKTLFTALQQMVGTPAYMSPEQTALSGTDVDTRSDVYSLGVLLYELLTGATPIDKATLHRAGFEEMRRMIRESEPPKPSTRLRMMGEELPAVARHRHTEPSTLVRLVHGDLDRIAMKALEKDRARRYQTITAPARDIECHLTSKPVTAGPPGVLYRTRKFVRRHKFAAALSASAVAAVLLSVAALAYGLIEARQESERADAEARNAKAEAAVSAAVNKFLLDDLLGQASPESEPDRDVTLRTLVDRAAKKADKRFGGYGGAMADGRAYNCIFWGNSARSHRDTYDAGTYDCTTTDPLRRPRRLPPPTRFSLHRRRNSGRWSNGRHRRNSPPARRRQRRHCSHRHRPV